MALSIKEIKQLMLTVAKADRKSPVAYSFNEKNYGLTDLNEALRVELNLLAGNFNSYRRNQLDIFELMQEVIDLILPKKVLEQYGAFAEVKTYAQGDKPTFILKLSKNRAKQFITRVGLAGIYEVFKLDKSVMEITCEAYGGAAQIGLEEFLDGAVDFGEILDIVMLGLDESVYREIAKSLIVVNEQLQGANKAAFAGFNEPAFDKLLNVARAYGEPVIYATLEMASLIVPATAWVSQNMIDARNNVGYIGIYKGSKVVILPQSFEDETNIVQVIDPGFVYIIPSGANAKPVKIAFEGQTIVDEAKNRDQSREVQVYKKFGVATVASNNMCIYENTTLSAAFDATH